ncbi:hypothetical protein QYF36_009383 [Acer negundo]|nr:hypothetical protein QYF36_009383 [Acer negundo]
MSCLYSLFLAASSQINQREEYENEGARKQYEDLLHSSNTKIFSTRLWYCITRASRRYLENNGSKVQNEESLEAEQNGR